MTEETDNTTGNETNGQTRRSLITAIIALLIFALIGGGYYYFFFRNGHGEAEEKNIEEIMAPPPPPASSQANPTPRVISIDSWLRYRNDQYGFEIKYPADWAIEPSFGEFSKYVYLNPRSAATGGIKPAVAVEMYPEQKTLAEVAANFDYLGGNSRNLTIGGVLAKEIISTDQYGRKVVMLAAAKNNMGFSVTAGGSDTVAVFEVAKRILSTFTFVK